MFRGGWSHIWAGQWPVNLMFGLVYSIEPKAHTHCECRPQLPRLQSKLQQVCSEKRNKERTEQKWLPLPFQILIRFLLRELITNYILQVQSTLRTELSYLYQFLGNLYEPFSALRQSPLKNSLPAPETTLWPCVNCAEVMCPSTCFAGESPKRSTRFN